MRARGQITPAPAGACGVIDCPRHPVSLRRAAAALTILAASCAPLETPPTRALGPGTAGDLPPMRLFPAAPATPPTRANAAIARDFLDLSFRMESGRPLPVLSRFEGPITVRITGAAPASLGHDLDRLILRLQREAGIDIARIDAGAASVTIEAVPNDRLRRAIPDAACFVIPRVSSWAEYRAVRRTPAVDWTTLRQRERVAIFLPADVSPQEMRDCLHEELAQAIGPLNDLWRLPDSVFNDDNIHAVLTGFDMLILRAYFAPEMAGSPTRAEATARLPALLARLNPAGERPGAATEPETTPDWISRMEVALTRFAAPARRRAAAAEAADLASAAAWDGTRHGFSLYALGRLQMAHRPDRAQDAFEAAARAYGQSKTTRLHAAHIAVQRAAFTLGAADGPATRAIVAAALPAAAEGENAALLATLLMLRAEALELEGRPAEARAVRLDSLGWARYGFGSDRAVRARLAQIQRLNPSRKAPQRP